MRGNASKYPSKQETRVSAKGRLVRILYGCTINALDAFTPEHLAATHNVPLRECEYMLIVAKQKRAGERTFVRAGDE